jgi:hypothetical protein
MSKSSTKQRGRPKKHIDILWKGWEKDVLDLYEEGASDTEIKALILRKTGTFSNDLWERWMKEEKIFSETITKGRLLSQAWWESKGRENITQTSGGKDVHTNIIPAMYQINMRNRFGWDKQEKTPDKVTVIIQDDTNND